MKRPLPLWRWWLAPRSVSMIAGVLAWVIIGYLALTATWASWSWQQISAIAGMLVWLAIDRFDVWYYPERPPLIAALLLLALRGLLIGAAAHSIGSVFTIFLLAVLPYLAAIYLDAGGVYLVGALTWLLGVGILLKNQPALAIAGTHADEQYVATLILLSTILVIASAIALLAIAERHSRERTERLLVDLTRSQQLLADYADEALVAINERHRLAHTIHNSLEQALVCIGLQLDNACASHASAPSTADQAVYAAKQQASAALADVRRSVGALRTRRELSIPAWSGPSTLAPEPSAHHWWRWLLPHTFDLIPTAAFLGILAMYLSESPFWSWQSMLVGCVLLGLIAIDRIETWHFGERTPRRATIVLIGLRLLLCAVYVAVAGWWWLIWLLPLLQYIGFRYAGKRGGLILVAFTFVGFLMVGFAATFIRSSTVTSTSLSSALLLLALNLLLVLIPNQSLLNERASRQQAEALLAYVMHANQQLNAYALQIATASEERNHLAREIHDGLGHYLTVINVQLEKALAFRTRNLAIADQAVHDARRMAYEALHEVREAMGILDAGQTSFSLVATIHKLVEQQGDLQIDLHVFGQESAYDQQTLLALYRVIQEGLTNIRRHAHASHARINLTFTPQEATLTIHDNGCGFAPTDTNIAQADHYFGYGLRGIRERIELLGGHLELETAPARGTTLQITFPRNMQAVARSLPAIQQDRAHDE